MAQKHQLFFLLLDQITFTAAPLKWKITQKTFKLLKTYTAFASFCMTAWGLHLAYIANTFLTLKLGIWNVCIHINLSKLSSWSLLLSLFVRIPVKTNWLLLLFSARQNLPNMLDSRVSICRSVRPQQGENTAGWSWGKCDWRHAQVACTRGKRAAEALRTVVKR